VHVSGATVFIASHAIAELSPVEAPAAKGR
jgi:hypothetical protein